MVTLCHAIDDSEAMFVRALLQSFEIPFFVIGENFGNLYPGLQIPAYNERRFVVPEEYFDEANSMIEKHRSLYEPSFVNLTAKSKIRIVIETFLLGWSVPSGNKKNH